MASIQLKNVHLSYPIYGSDAQSFKSTLIHIATGGKLSRDNKHVHVDALTDISLNLEKGDRLAILGHNGAGKSTLLRVLAGIYTPTKGTIHIEGKSNCLFDIMMGMDPELNGYENIILRGRIAGLSKEEAKKIIPKVEAFAELGDFITMPFKTYSAGMQIRLAFGIITSITADILLIDEVIGVGDAAFLQKAQKQIEKLIDTAEILVLSTHDLHTAKKLCNKILTLEHGKMKLAGNLEFNLASFVN